MAVLGDVDNEFLRAELEEYVEDVVERQSMVDLYAATGSPMQAIAAAIIIFRVV